MIKQEQRGLRRSPECPAPRLRRPPCQTGRSCQDRAQMPGSELSRQVPVDLEPDADLNEGRGAPGHWSSSLTFPSSNKLDRGTPPRNPSQLHGRKHRRRLLSKGILLQAAPWDSQGQTEQRIIAPGKPI